MECNQDTFRYLRSHPAVVGILTFIFFPIGLWLVWTHPGWTKKTKWIWTGVIGLFALVSLANRDGPSSPDATSITPSGRSASGNGGATKGVHAIGETFPLGNYTYRIDGVEKLNEIGNYAFGRFMGKRASAGATLLVVAYTIENTSTETQTVLADDFQVRDSQGRTYRASSDANTALMIEQSGDKDFLFSELQPGIPRRMQQAFEVPVASLSSPIEIIVPEKGMWSSGTAVIEVPPSP
jgi:hypothetical protein